MGIQLQLYAARNTANRAFEAAELELAPLRSERRRSLFSFFVVVESERRKAAHGGEKGGGSKAR
jgi:hypothetical protein